MSSNYDYDYYNHNTEDDEPIIIGRMPLPSIDYDRLAFLRFGNQTRDEQLRTYYQLTSR